MKLKHKITNKIYDWENICYMNDYPIPFDPRGNVKVRTLNDYKEQIGERPSLTNSYIEEPLSDFEVIE